MNPYHDVGALPIDLPRIDINEALLDQLMDQHDTGHHDALWKAMPLVADTKDFGSAELVESGWEKRYSADCAPKINQAVYHQFKPLFNLLELLPMRVTHAQILCQTAYVGRHFDLKNDGNQNFFDDAEGLYDDIEPVSYKILLNCRDENSFFVCGGFQSEKKFVRLPADTSTFVINEKRYPHGAIMTTRPKYIVSVFGQIDRDEHIDLLDRSMMKYSNQSVCF